MTEVANQTDSKVSPLMQAGTPKPLGSISAPKEASYNYKMYPVNLASAAIVGQCVEIQGEKIYYMEGQSRLRIRMESLNNDYIDLYPGRKIVCPFHRFFIDAPKADEVVKLLISSPHWVQMHGEGVEVNTLVRDKSLFRETELKRAFACGVYGNPVAGEYTGEQLFNPANSSILCVLRTCQARTNVAGQAYLGMTTVSFVTSSTAGINKYAGQAVSVCTVKTDSDAVITNLIPAVSTIVQPVYIVQTGQNIFEFDDNIILPPGYGFAIVMSTVNVAVIGMFQWIELPLSNISSF